MRATEFLADLVHRLDGAEIGYALVGSIAAMSFGEPRATLDIDVVVALDRSNLPTLEALFPHPEFYLSAEAAREAVASSRLILPGVEAWCSPPEELVVKKLSYYQQGGRTST